MRRRAVVRTAAVGGAAYYAGKRREGAAQREADQDAQIAAPAPAPSAPSAAPTAPSAAPTMEDKIEQIKQLAQLHSDGILTDEEFSERKQAILGS